MTGDLDCGKPRPRARQEPEPSFETNRRLAGLMAFVAAPMSFVDYAGFILIGVEVARAGFVMASMSVMDERPRPMRRSTSHRSQA